MFGIGGWELLMVAVVALLVLGPKGLPSAARAIGRVASELRRAANDLRQSIELDPELKELPQVLDDIKRPLLSNPYQRKRPPRDSEDGSADDLPSRPPRRDIEIDEDVKMALSQGEAGSPFGSGDEIPPYAAAAIGGDAPPPLTSEASADESSPIGGAEGEDEEKDSPTDGNSEPAESRRTES